MDGWGAAPAIVLVHSSGWSACPVSVGSSRFVHVFDSRLDFAAREPLAARLTGAPPGADLVADLAGVDVAEVSDEALVEVVAGWERVVSWATAAQAGAVAEMWRRAGRAGAGTTEFVGDEVAVALAVSRRSGEVLVERAVFLDAAPEVGDALAAGALTVRKADALARGTAHLGEQDARTVHRAVLDRAPGLTVPQLRAAVRRAEILLDPAAAGRRHERARRERCVWLEPAPDAMAWVKAFLPAQDAARVVTAVDALAAAAAPGDQRPVGARRADALVDVLGAVLDAGLDLVGRALPTRQGRRAHVAVTMSLASLTGASGTPAELAGYGPVPASVGRRVAAAAAWQPVVLDPRTGEVLERSTAAYRPSPALAARIVDRDVTCTFPGCRIPAERCDLDHIQPFDPTRDAVPQTRTGNLAALCRHHHRMKTHGGWTPSRDPASGVTSWVSRTGHVYTRDPVPAPFEAEALPRRGRSPSVDADALLSGSLGTGSDQVTSEARDPGRHEDREDIAQKGEPTAET